MSALRRIFIAVLLTAILACGSAAPAVGAPVDRPRPSTLGNDAKFLAIWDAVYGTDDAQAAVLMFLAAPTNGGDLGWARSVARAAYNNSPACNTALLYEAGWLVVELFRNSRQAVKDTTWGSLLIAAAGSAIPVPTMSSGIAKAIVNSSTLTGLRRSAALKALAMALGRFEALPSIPGISNQTLRAAVKVGTAVYWRGAAWNRLGSMLITCGI